MQPNNPIVGGITLRIPAIRSPDYVAGVSGWTINVDGTAEFNNVTIRGTFITGTVPGAHVTIAGGQILIFDSTNTLVGQIDQNGIVALGTNGSLVRMYNVAGVARLGLLPGGSPANEGSVIAGFSGGQPQLVIRSPQQTSNLPNNQSLIELAGAATALPSVALISADSATLSGINGASVVCDSSGVTILSSPSTLVLLQTSNMSVLNTSGQVALPMGRGGYIDSTANSAAIGAETIVFTLSGLTLRNGRAYQFRIKHTLQATGVTLCTMRVHKTNLAGTGIADRFVEVDTNFQSMDMEMGIARNDSGTDIIGAIAVFSLQVAAGTVTQVQSASRLRSFEMWDIGASTDYPNTLQW